MRTITTVVDPEPDGTIRLTLPEELCKGRIEVVVVAHPTGQSDDAEDAEGPRSLQRLKLWEEIVRRNPFRDIADPVQWQREMRLDRPLPGRNG